MGIKKAKSASAARAKVAEPAPVAEETTTTTAADESAAEEDQSNEDEANRGPDKPDGPGVTTANTEGAEADEDSDDDNDHDDEDEDDGDDEFDSGEPAGSGDSVTMRTNDGVTYASNDGATGDNNTGSENTKTGDAPEGVNRDVQPGERAATGAMSHGDAVVAELAPAAALHGPKRRGDLTERAILVLGDFAAKKDTTFTNQANIHDDLGIERAELPSLRDEIENEFDVNITPSEAQNWLLVRDVVNTVLRKVAAQG